MSKIQNDLVENMQKWRRHMHRHPETEFDVYETADYIGSILREFGVEVHERIGQSGLVAVLRKGANPDRKAIALRADMDAMPIEEQNTFEYRSRNKQKMHACGHDGHSAMLLGAAAYLAEHGKFDGTVNFVFQPNEEHGLGAQAMIDDGLFKRFPASECYGLHNLPGLEAGVLAMRPGATMASENLFQIEIAGRGGHASSPHLCIDPTIVAAQIVLSLQTITSRTANPLESIVVSVTEIHTDGARNVIPSNVTIKGDCRTFSEANTALVEKRLGEIANATAAMYGAACKFSFSREFIVSVNSAAETEAVASAALSVNGPQKVDTNCEPRSFSEDFAHMQKVVPGCYVFLGNGTDSVGGCMLHNPNYDFNDEILATGANYWVALVEQQLGT
ncbi:MAG: amidohydrolase [Gammaproteobacteria bacterium]|nr:MAG: amidohydrolase [Gammaproteobacteria bacterium]